MIVLQNASCVLAIRSLSMPDSQGAAHYNLVQDALWPQVEATEEEPDAHDLPGSWTAAATYKTSAQLPQNGHMAHTMRIGRVLRPVPVPSAGLMKASTTACSVCNLWARCFMHTVLQLSCLPYLFTL